MRNALNNDGKFSKKTETYLLALYFAMHSCSNTDVVVRRVDVIPHAATNVQNVYCKFVLVSVHIYKKKKV